MEKINILNKIKFKIIKLKNNNKLNKKNQFKNIKLKIYFNKYYKKYLINLNFNKFYYLIKF